jgi:8-amino-7-oxononanoate synthase
MYAQEIPHRTIRVDSREYLFFGGTAYLGMHARLEFRDKLFQGFELYGTNYGASRLGNVNIPVFEEMESALATWLGAESALLVSSGTLAGRLTLEVLGKDYRYHYMPNAHIAVHPAYAVHEPASFDPQIQDAMKQMTATPDDLHVITCNSIDALTATEPSWDWLSALPNPEQAVLVIDDSHGLGVVGNHGQGRYKFISDRHRQTILIASLGKAMGLPGGVIAGPASFIKAVKKHPLFGGSSPMIPAYAYAFLNAQEVYSHARKSLQQNIDYFKKNCSCLELFTFLDQFPIFCTARHDLAPFLESHEIRIPHFRYPSQLDPLYTRIIVNGLHQTDDLDKLIQALADFA